MTQNGVTNVGDAVVLDKTIISWLMAAGGAFILFLLSLGIKDLKSRIDSIPRINEEVIRVRTEHETELENLNKLIQIQNERITELKEEIRRLKDVVHC